MAVFRRKTHLQCLASLERVLLFLFRHPSVGHQYIVCGDPVYKAISEQGYVWNLRSGYDAPPCFHEAQLSKSLETRVNRVVNPTAPNLRLGHMEWLG